MGKVVRLSPRVPPRRFDPVVALVWLVLAPLTAAIGWYGVWRVVVGAIWLCTRLHGLQ